MLLIHAGVLRFNDGNIHKFSFKYKSINSHIFYILTLIELNTTKTKVLLHLR